MTQQTLQNLSAPKEKGEAPRVLYVYAITPEGLLESLPDKGIDGKHCVERIRSGGLQAIVSRVPYDSYHKEALIERAKDHEWFEKAVRRHTAIIGEIHSDAGIIPMRFLTLCKNVEEVNTFLQTNAEKLSSELRSVSGAQEWGVKIFCDTEKLQQYVDDRKLSDTLADNQYNKKRRGTSFLLEKKRKRNLKELLIRICIECKEDCHAQLAALARSAEIVSSQKTAGSGQQDPIIFNGAYLIENQKTAVFCQKAEALSELVSEKGFEIGLSGPWPPYHFVKQIS